MQFTLPISKMHPGTINFISVQLQKRRARTVKVKLRSLPGKTMAVSGSFLGSKIAWPSVNLWCRSWRLPEFPTPVIVSR